MIVGVNVEGQSLRWYDRSPKIANMSIRFVKFKFNLSPDWDGYEVTAQFTQKETYNVLLDDDYCDLPPELTDGPCLVSVFGYKSGQEARATVIPLVFSIEKSGFVGNGQTPIPPTPDLYAQLLSRVNMAMGRGVPIIQSGTWWLWNAELSTYVDSGVSVTSSGLELDPTLTKEGTAADAKAVGDAISKLSGGNADLTGYATERWVGENYQPKGEYLTEVPEGYAKTEDIPEAYTLPIATETTLGGVKAAAATEEMTQPVGITAEGKLVTVPGQNSGGNVDYVGVEPAEDDIPKVFITGVKPTTKDDVLAEMEYVSKTDKFNAYLEIKCQGTSSMSYPKKNFTVKLYSDEARETKLKKDFKNWNHESNKFVLKANYIDHAHARNIVSARLWGEIVARRPDYDSLPAEMRNAPNNGAVDGFPIKVYYNGNYDGVYTWNIGKDDWMWGMDEDNANHVLLCAEGNTDGVYAETTSNFRKLWDGVDGSKPGWSVEVGTNSTALKNSLNDLIQFVMDNDGDAFRNGIGQYLDIQSAIDYYIFQYEICGLDGLAHNMLLATYDGKLWRCGAYDLDATFGLWWNGTKFVSATFACPEDYQERYSLLWERIEANFLPELKARQAELRKTVLSYSNIVTHFERFMDIIGLDLYAEDLTIYSTIPSGSANNIKQIRNYIRDRQAYVDAEFAAMVEPVPCTGITLDKSTLTFTTEDTQVITATVTPEGCTDVVTWESTDNSIAVVSGGVVSAIGNGTATIIAKCGKYSASCFVTVNGIGAIDYTRNPLDGVSWNDNQKYERGELVAQDGDYVTDKFTLQACVYDFQTGDGNSYAALYAWNKNGDYVGNAELASGSIGRFVAKSGWQYAVKVANSSVFDASTVSLLPVDQAEDAAPTVVIDATTLEWSNSGTNVAEAVITDIISGAGFALSKGDIASKVNTCSHMFMLENTFAGSGFNGTGNGVVLMYTIYNNDFYLRVPGFTADTVAENVGTITIN